MKRKNVWEELPYTMPNLTNKPTVFKTEKFLHSNKQSNRTEKHIQLPMIIQNIKKAVQEVEK